jgi:fermentation-respiration switch protein FrsA (DUF1100 family)
MSVNNAYLLGFLLLSVACLYFFYQQIENFFVFHPQKKHDFTPSQWRLDCEDLYLETSDKTKLHGWFFPLDGDVPTILFCHGNAGNISHRLENIRLLVDQGLQVFIFDYRGYGKSEGKSSEAGLYCDGLAAYDFLVNQKGIPPRRLVLFGRSLGAAVAIEIALQRKARSMIIESAFTSTKDMAKTMVLFWPIALFSPPNYNNKEKIGRVDLPKLIIHGDRDDIIPFSMGKTLYDLAQPPKYFLPIKGAGHNDTYVTGGKAYIEALGSFAKEK